MSGNTLSYPLLGVNSRSDGRLIPEIDFLIKWQKKTVIELLRAPGSKRKPTADIRPQHRTEMIIGARSYLHEDHFFGTGSYSNDQCKVPGIFGSATIFSACVQLLHHC